MKNTLIIILQILFCAPGFSQTPAFKGAEGYGAAAVGGRGGEIFHVTNLDDSGVGSFRNAVSAPNRIVVFDVSGTVFLKTSVNVSSNITINGQTAPGEGITLSGQSVRFSKAHDIIVRYLRLHGSINMARGSCVLIADSANNIIFDHMSVVWGRWDNVHIKGSHNITLQYCIIGEGIDPQRFGALLEGPVDLSIHHCLWIDNQSRNPKAKAKIQLINNVVYNWGHSGLIGGHSAGNHFQDVINNYFIEGPSSNEQFLAMFTKTDHVFQKGNYFDNNKNGQLDGRLVDDTDFLNAGKGATIIHQASCSPRIKVSVESAKKAYENILKNVGCSKVRDAVDQQLISQLSSLGSKGAIIHSNIKPE
ncbi:pectate lyase family protein [Arachidicoccus sp.]|uniref:pectate lyase family protein n=1 Tax=Arachidicoccus sp. TaxID=1872624 RepID=UPI003D21FD71